MSKREVKTVLHGKYGVGSVTADEEGRFTRTTEGNNVVSDVLFNGESVPRAILVTYLSSYTEKRAA